MTRPTGGCSNRWGACGEMQLFQILLVFYLILYNSCICRNFLMTQMTTQMALKQWWTVRWVTKLSQHPRNPAVRTQSQDMNVPYLAKYRYQHNILLLTSNTLSVHCMSFCDIQCESKKQPPKTLRYFYFWFTCLTENYLDYCPNTFLFLHQFWSIYLNMCMNCITFTSKTTQNFNNLI